MLASFLGEAPADSSFYLATRGILSLRQFAFVQDGPLGNAADAAGGDIATTNKHLVSLRAAARAIVDTALKEGVLMQALERLDLPVLSPAIASAQRLPPRRPRRRAQLGPIRASGGRTPMPFSQAGPT